MLRTSPLPAPSAYRSQMTVGLSVVAVLAVALRLAFMVASGGWHSAIEYDDGVHYASAALLLHGQWPYHDQTFLQPPGITVVMLPFAALGRVVGDQWGLAFARLATCLVGGIVTYRLGTLVAAERRPWRGLVAGLVYATAASGLVAGSTVLLEPWLSLFIVLAWGWLLRSAQGSSAKQVDDSGSRARDVSKINRDIMLAGLAFGAAGLIKTWGAVSLLVGALWLVLGGRRRHAIRLVISAAATALLVLSPFLVLAPSQTWRDIVTAQLRRPPSGIPGLWGRITDMAGARSLIADSLARNLVTATLVVVVAMLATRVWRDVLGRLAVLGLGAGILMFDIAGPYYTHYGEFVVLPVAAIVGLGLPQSSTALRSLAALGLAGLVGLQLTSAFSRAVPATVNLGALRRALPPRGCVLSDQPVLLELADRLSTDHCPQWLDPRGSALTTLGPHPPRNFYPDGFQRLPAWQAEWRSRFDMADAMILSGSPCGHVEWTKQTCQDLERQFVFAAIVGHAGPGRVPVQVWTRRTGN
jgi:alpha-1,2-mannosyltransferase